MDTDFLKRCSQSGIEPFKSRIGRKIIANSKPTTMQVNIGYRCSLACRHCYLECGPNSTEEMSRETMEDCLAVFSKNPSFKVLDITGGSPEMNPNFAWFLEKGSKLGKVIVRSNLAILDNPEYAYFIDLYTQLKPTIFTSMGCSEEPTVDKQRGAGTYKAMTRVMRKLNELGYGRQPDMELNILFTSLTPGLPPDQSNLDPIFRKNIKNFENVEFTHLYTNANVAVGRFGKSLSDDEFTEYQHLLANNFNAANMESIMCLSQINVDWDGRIYDCDSCHAIGVPANVLTTISALRGDVFPEREIALTDLCYVCTAGAGSSCGGNLS